MGRGLVSHLGMGYAWVDSVDISVNEAFTARAFDSPVRSVYGLQGSNQSPVMIVVSGLPLRHDGQVLGAVGVMRGSGQQDQTVAGGFSGVLISATTRTEQRKRRETQDGNAGEQSASGTPRSAARQGR
ncbi:heme-binding protein [Streptomyces sp. SYSU K217416]